ncbi:YtxH domain-containing protein [Herbiconiux sp. P18]|uniref:YtxH domain-containing protein n=1 Tax=Herbiconiux liangxiaofengii TaxID=3342795 RepID=UPI0035BA8CB2
MRGKFVFVVGLATGYVLGTRAGRERYVQIKSGADKVWNLPVVQSGVDRVQEFAGARVDTVKANLSKRARKALAGLIGREPLDGPQQSRAAAKAGSTRPKTPVKAASTSTAAKSAAAKPAAAKPAAAKPATSDKPSAGTASPESDD